MSAFAEYRSGSTGPINYIRNNSLLVETIDTDRSSYCTIMCKPYYSDDAPVNFTERFKKGDPIYLKRQSIEKMYTLQRTSIFDVYVPITYTLNTFSSVINNGTYAEFILDTVDKTQMDGDKITISGTSNYDGIHNISSIFLSSGFIHVTTTTLWTTDEAVNGLGVIDRTDHHPMIYLMNDRDFQSSPFSQMDNFIGASGYPFSSDTYLSFSRQLEHTTPINNLLNDFYVDFNSYEYSDALSINVGWNINPEVKATKIRWRSVPRNQNESRLSFSSSGSVKFTETPIPVIINSNTGSGALIELTGAVYSISLRSSGNDYTTAYPVFEGDGIGASASVTITSGSISSIILISGGTGYTYKPNIKIIGDGFNATAAVDVMDMTSIKVLQDGGGYLSAPSVSIDFTSATGSTAMTISSNISLNTESVVDYIYVTTGGTGYSDTSVDVIPSIGGLTATGTAEITNGVITNIILDNPGYFFQSNPSLMISGTGGTGAVLIANTDIGSNWIYEDACYMSNSKTIHGIKKGITYEIQILVSNDELFRGYCKYSDSIEFSYY